MRRAYALLRQGVACAEVSRGGPGEWRGRGAGRPSRACSRIVSPGIERPRAPICLWFTVPEAEMHEHINNRVRSVRNRVVNRRESGGLWLWLRRERDGGKRLRLSACPTQTSGDGRVPGRPSRACPRIGSPRDIGGLCNATARAHAQPDRRVSIDAVGRRPSRIRLWTLMSSVGRTRHFASIVAFSASTIRWKLQPGFPSK